MLNSTNISQKALLTKPINIEAILDQSEKVSFGKSPIQARPMCPACHKVYTECTCLNN
ncbi:MAG: hypothetical protein CFH43_00281 [Proteobacteria bacterium]|nr:MAG: hypothetical protein CFH43_00281 [Pseudomonadota bacterium]